MADELKVVRENFDNKTWKTLLESSIDDTITMMKRYDKITADKKIFFDMILDNRELTKADVEKLITHADDIDIS